jgi:hypothetical protein
LVWRSLFLRVGPTHDGKEPGAGAVSRW